MWRYDPPIGCAGKAMWCLAEAERRYEGKRQFEDGFPYIVDADGRFFFTDAVLRAIGVAIAEGIFSVENVVIH